jgi:hypothetical protein
MTASSPTCPGVSVEELSSSVRGISMVTTSVAVSVGHACQGPVIQAATSTGFAEFERRSGGLRVTDDHDPHSPGGFQSAGHGRRRSAEFHTGPVHTRRPGRCAHRTAAFAVPARSVPGIVTPRGALRHMRQGHHPAVRLRPRDHPCHHPIRTGQASGMRDRHDRAAGRAVREPGLSSWSSPSMNNGSSPPRTVRFTASSGMAGSSRGPWEQPAAATATAAATDSRATATPTPTTRCSYAPSGAIRPAAAGTIECASSAKAGKTYAMSGSGAASVAAGEAVEPRSCDTCCATPTRMVGHSDGGSSLFMEGVREASGVAPDRGL